MGSRFGAGGEGMTFRVSSLTAMALAVGSKPSI